MTHSVETAFSMEDTESSDYMSSCDSMYSLDSASSVEDDYDTDVFLSDGCEEEEEKDEVDNKGRREDYAQTERLVLSPEAKPSPSRKSSQKCLDNQYRTHRHGLQSMGNLQTTSPCTRYPFLLEKGTLSSNRSWLIDKNANVSVGTYNENSDEGGVKRSIHPVMERKRSEHTITSEAPGIKRLRNRDEEGVWKRAGLSKRAPQSPKTEGDRIFAGKCKELQGFIKPLTGLLNGLKRGRFERGLSSFQQSVAMDRIQRIVGVLQKPEMGERYLGTLLQVERMLKVWFPHVAMNSSSSPGRGKEELESKQKHEQNYQENKNSPRQQAKRFAHSSHSPWRQSPSKTQAIIFPTETEHEAGATGKESAPSSADWSTMNLTWMHTSPIPNPPLSQADLGHLNTPFGQNLLAPNANRGFVLFLHNNSMSSPTYPRSTSSSPKKSLATFCLLKEHSAQTGDPPRSLSAPGAASVSSSRGLEVEGDHSRPLSHLPMPSKRPAQVSHWTWNSVSELKVKEGSLCSS